MDGWLDLNTIAPGTPVFDAEGMPLGQVEANEGDVLRVRGQSVSADAVARVDPAGIYLNLTGAAFAVGMPGVAPVETARTSHHDTVPVGGEHLTFPLAEERPVVTYRENDLGEIIIIKRVIEEERLMPVRIRREVLEVVRCNADGTETIEEFSETERDMPRE